MSDRTFSDEHTSQRRPDLETAPTSDVQRSAASAASRAAQGKEAVQRLGGSGADVHAAAAHGVQGSGGSLPHLDRIQGAFGKHDVTAVQAHVGGKAREASDAMGANAYATGNAVAFRESPDLHTAAHEAAHVVQQRGGVQLKGGVGQVGDRYEQHADAVADRVVQGRSAEDLLDRYADGSGSQGVQGKAVQRDYRHRTSGEVISDEEYEQRFGAGPQQEDHPWEYVEGGNAGEGGETRADGETPLTEAQRNALHTLLSSRLSSAYTKYSNACQEVASEIRAEQAARVELIMTLVSVGFVFATPALGRAITGLVSRVPASASVTTHRVALGMLDQADNIAGAMAEVGKDRAKAAASAALSSNATAYFDALDQAFSVTVDQIVSHVASNITNRDNLSDAALWLYVARWDPASITKAQYKRDLLARYQAFRQQVQPIGNDWIPEIRGTTNLGQNERGQWHLYEEYGRSRYVQRAEVAPEMLEAAGNRSTEVFGGPWRMQFLEDGMESGGYDASFYRRNGNARLPNSEGQ